MDRLEVDSSNIAEVGYDSASMTLEVMFVSGSVYQYFDVPEIVYQEFISASSIGRFLNEQIKESFRYTKL